MNGPNPLQVAWSIVRATRRRRPAPQGTGTIDHTGFRPILDVLAQNGVAALCDVRPDLDTYRGSLQTIDPDTLGRDEGLAFWLNLYNAAGLELAAEAFAQGQESVLRIPGAFNRPVVTITGEHLSLTDLEHGKIRRFHDPRIHAALVCGSVSCPTLRYEPFEGDYLDRQLDQQLRYFLQAGGAVADRERNELRLSRVLLWYGGDFLRPQRMPTWIPAPRKALVKSLLPWLADDVGGWVETSKPKVLFQSYDWSLGCAITRDRQRSGPADQTA